MKTLSCFCKSFGVVFTLFFFISCTKDVAVPKEPPPSKIEGLELSFNKTGFTGNFRKLVFLNENTGYVSDYGGAIHKTSNGGQTCTQQNSGTSLPFHDMYFFDENEGFAVGGRSSCGGTGCDVPGAIMLHTKDGGLTWSKVNLSLSAKVELAAIQFVNKTLGYAAGGGLVIVTNDGGATWKEISPSNQGTVFTALGFKDTQNGIILGPAGKVIKTANGGQTWETTQPLSYGGVNTLSIVDDNLVFATAGCYTYKSVDFGNNWTVYKNDLFAMGAVFFKTKDVGFTVGTGDYSGGDFGVNCSSIYYTTNGGATWTGNRQIKELNDLQAACFLNDRLGFVIGNGMLLKIKRL